MKDTKTVTIFKTVILRDYFTFEDFPETLTLRPTDRIYFEYVQDGYISDNNSIPEGGYLKVVREVPMTPEEIEQRRKDFQEKLDQAKAKRYQKYLKLQEEFKDVDESEIPKLDELKAFRLEQKFKDFE